LQIKGRKKEEEMKRWIKALMVGVVFVVMMAGAYGLVTAGLINHKVKVVNTTDEDCGVFLYYGSNPIENKWLRITAHQSGTFETGSKCPRFLNVGCAYPTSYTEDKCHRCTLGNDGWIDDCTATCWSSDWYIRKKSSGGVELTKE